MPEALHEPFPHPLLNPGRRCTTCLAEWPCREWLLVKVQDLTEQLHEAESRAILAEEERGALADAREYWPADHTTAVSHG